MTSPPLPTWGDGLIGPTHTYGRDLREALIPPVGAPIGDVWRFALTFDGYGVFREVHDDFFEFNHWAEERFRQTGELPRSLVQLRVCLFYKAREDQMAGGMVFTMLNEDGSPQTNADGSVKTIGTLDYPPDDRRYVDALVDAIRQIKGSLP